MATRYNFLFCGHLSRQEAAARNITSWRGYVLAYLFDIIAATYEDMDAAQVESHAKRIADMILNL